MPPTSQSTGPELSNSASIQLYLPPSSPLFKYSPGLAGNSSLTGEWKGTNQNGSVAGNMKQTSGDAAFILDEIHLTSFTPIFDSSNIYAPTLQSSSASSSERWTSNQTYTQPFGSSTLTFSVSCSNPSNCPSTPFSFRGGVLGTQVAPPAQVVKNVIADDASGLIQYTGWSAAGADNSLVAAGEGDYGGTLSMTSTANASAIVRFRGTAVLLRGVTAPPLGRLEITLDTGPAQILSAQDEVTTHDVPLFFASAVGSDDIHELQLVTLSGDSRSGESTGAVIDRVEVWGQEGKVGFIGKDGNLVVPTNSNIGSPTPSDSVPGNGTTSGESLPGATSGGAPNAGAIVGIIIGVLAALVLLYYFFKRYGRPILAKPAATSANKWDAANNLQVMKQEAVFVTTAAEQRYVYPGMIAHSDLSK